MQKIRLNYSKTWFSGRPLALSITKLAKRGNEKKKENFHWRKNLEQKRSPLHPSSFAFPFLKSGAEKGGKEKGPLLLQRGREREENWKNLADKAEHFSLLPLLFFPLPLASYYFIFPHLSSKSGRSKNRLQFQCYRLLPCPGCERRRRQKKGGRRGNVQ